MINLLEMFGKEYKVDFDKQRHSLDIKATGSKYRNAFNEKAWYYSIPCKYGDIYIADNNDRLMFYCKSARIARKIENIMSGKPVDCHITDADAVIYFPFKYINEIFTFAKPRKKKQMTDEHKAKLVSRLAQYRRKKAENNQ